MTDGLDKVLLGPLDLRGLGVAAALHAACFDEPWHETAMAEILGMPGSFGALAHIGHEPVGLVIVLALGTEAEILTLGVLPKVRRRGIARRLLALVADRLGGTGCQRLLLEVAEDNVVARPLYEKIGFAEIGRRPSYYRRSAGTAGAIVMACALDRLRS